MRKVMILAYDFPPYVSVGGLRPYNWFKYFHEFGVEPIVITRQWSNEHSSHLDYISPGKSDKIIIEKSKYGTILRTPYHPNKANRLMLKYGRNRFRLIRKLITGYYEFAQFLAYVGPKKEIYKAAKEYLKNNKVDAIIATGGPYVLFKYGSDLSQEYNLPWIADYRDPWTQNIYMQKKPLLKYWSSYFEKKILKTASVLTTVDQFFATKILSSIKDIPYFILPNGFDPEATDEIKEINQQSDELRISFVGSIYDWHPLESILTVFNKFIADNQEEKIKLHFYGVNDSEVIERLINDKLEGSRNNIVISPKMSNTELLRKLALDNVMLLFNYYSFTGTKIFDYIGIKRKILFCYENDEEANELKRKYYKLDESDSVNKQIQVDIINQTKSGIIVKDSEHLYNVLGDLYSEFTEKGCVSCNSIDTDNYSRKVQVQQLANIVIDL